MANSIGLHGGNLSEAKSRFGKMSWVDLSTGVNPWPYPLPFPVESDWANLPDVDQYEALRLAAARFYGANPRTTVVISPGTQALIQWLPYLVKYPGRSLRVAVFSPTYTEHAITWRSAGHDVISTNVSMDPSSLKVDVAVIVNPNNPDGFVYTREYLLNLAKYVNLLVIDEAFVDTCPQVSFVPLLWTDDINSSAIVVLRSFGKFFGLAGARLGFALTAQSVLAERLKTALGPWAVSGAVLRIGTAALSDNSWINMTRSRLCVAARRLDKELKTNGFSVIGGTTLFRLVDCGRHYNSIYSELGRVGILVRAFPYLPSKLRFGLPGNAEEWRRLENALHFCSSYLEPKK